MRLDDGSVEGNQGRNARELTGTPLHKPESTHGTSGHVGDMVVEVELPVQEDPEVTGDRWATASM